MPTIIFAPECRYISETTRAVAIAKKCPPEIKPVFISYGGQYEHYITRAGFPLYRMEPYISSSRSTRMFRIEHMETLGEIIPKEDLEERILNEIELFEKLEPVAVLNGFIHSLAISTQIVGVPLVWLTPAVMTKPYYKAGLAVWPGMLDFKALRWVPERMLNWTINKTSNLSMLFFSSVNSICRKHGVKTFRSFTEFLETGYTLLSDVPEIIGIKHLPETYRWVGPFLTKLDAPAPEEIAEIPDDMPLVYFAMGSSGHPGIIKYVLDSFRGAPFRVIAPVKTLIEGRRAVIPADETDPSILRAGGDISPVKGAASKEKFRKKNPALIEEMVREMTPYKPPENVMITDWLPAHIVNPLADVAVTHGGQGTLYQAILSGTPIVGVGMQPEQENNLECLVRHKVAVRIKRRRVDSKNVREAVLKMLSDTDAKKRIKELGRIVEKYDGPQQTSDFLMEKFINNRRVLRSP